MVADLDGVKRKARAQYAADRRQAALDRLAERRTYSARVYGVCVLTTGTVPWVISNGLSDLVQAGASIQISQDYSSMVNFARCKCLGANVLRGPDQKPWDGKLKYDWQLWIDSDIVFNTEKFYQLILMDQDIASGWYCTEDGQTTSVAHWMEEDDFRNNGGVMNHETLESIQKRRKPFTVDYAGFGWLLIKNGVFEHEGMPYPWFAPKMQVFESGEVQDMCGEDVSFCLDAKEAGFEIWCDPRIRVGHEKTRVI